MRRYAIAPGRHRLRPGREAGPLEGGHRAGASHDHRPDGHRRRPRWLLTPCSRDGRRPGGFDPATTVPTSVAPRPPRRSRPPSPGSRWLTARSPGGPGGSRSRRSRRGHRRRAPRRRHRHHRRGPRLARRSPRRAVRRGDRHHDDGHATSPRRSPRCVGRDGATRSRRLDVPHCSWSTTRRRSMAVAAAVLLGASVRTAGRRRRHRHQRQDDRRHARGEMLARSGVRSLVIGTLTGAPHHTRVDRPAGPALGLRRRRRRGGRDGGVVARAGAAPRRRGALRGRGVHQPRPRPPRLPRHRRALLRGEGDPVRARPCGHRDPQRRQSARPAAPRHVERRPVGRPSSTPSTTPAISPSVRRAARSRGVATRSITPCSGASTW